LKGGKKLDESGADIGIWQHIGTELAIGYKDGRKD